MFALVDCLPMRISALYIAKHEDYQVLSPHAVRVFSLWILLYWKHQETTRKSINRLMDALEELKQAKRYEQLKIKS